MANPAMYAPPTSHESYTQRLKFVRSVYQGMAFSRAVRGPWMTAALAADEGASGAEALTTFTFSAARLKAMP
jgi:hypothetical protein